MPPATCVATEYGTLCRVAMRYAGDFTRPLAGPEVHPVLARQQATSSWATYDPAAVRAQQDQLIGLLRDRGAEVVLLPPAPGCSVQHYPRDLAFAVDHVLFRARLNSEHRLAETDALTDPALGLRLVDLTRGTIEGGDVLLPDTGRVLVGLSEETSLDGAVAFQEALARHGVDREVVPVHFKVKGIVHLDDHLAVVAPGTALIHREAFTADQNRWFDAHFDDLVPVTDAEARAVQVNVLAIAPTTIVVAAGSDRIAAALTARGLEVLTVDYGEVTRIPGSLRCTTLPLLRT
ncbi:N-dimethylarginine dimethylaminohydrolase [Streptomyces sp. Go40/10]|uniref:dimethylarginine dimethylaminohydrolase family protein n=1 Tax=Streptomyces sp. Go40/10 TaxID=2825844 RepID=UPI001E62014E|nr:arginine deiminase family protein [Streptomyces sp. Go40/10]UFQ99799.1 N-dimethylarginine dimethylaminohydrolase [Streptomyces sp. Go40/10]